MKLLFLLVAVIAFPGCTKHTTPCTYELPVGYVGWVLIEYEKSVAPEIPVVSGRRVLTIGPSGHFATSSIQEFGIVSDQFVYMGTTRTELRQTFWGGGGLVWARSNGSLQSNGSPARFFEVFFVGSEAQYKANAAQQPTPEKPPNQALEPTTPAVTIPAAQEVAPAGVVAHL